MKRLKVYEEFQSDQTSTLDKLADLGEKHIEVLDSNKIEGTPGDIPEVEPFEWSEFRRGVLEPQVWIIGIGNMMAVIGLNSFSFFL